MLGLLTPAAETAGPFGQRRRTTVTADLVTSLYALVGMVRPVTAPRARARPGLRRPPSRPRPRH